MVLDWSLVLEQECDKIGVRVLDGVNFNSWSVSIEYQDGTEFSRTFQNSYQEFTIVPKATDDAVLFFQNDSDVADVVIIEVSYFKNGIIVGSSLVSDGASDLKLLKYKVELPVGAKVTLFDDESLEVQFLSWNLPCPKPLQSATFLQYKAANGFEQQSNAAAGEQTMELWTELGRRYAVFAEIWTYSFAQTLWFADLRVQLSNYDWLDIVPTAGEGGTIVTALPQ